MVRPLALIKMIRTRVTRPWGSGGEYGAVVGGQHFKPVGDIGSVVVAGLEREFKVRAQEKGRKKKRRRERSLQNTKQGNFWILRAT